MENQITGMKIGRDLVEDGDIGAVLGHLRSLTSGTPQDVLARQGNSDIVFEGYDRDRREIWQIPEIVAYARALDAQWDYWLYFFSLELTGLQGVALCLAGASDRGDGTLNIDSAALGELVQRWIPPMNKVGRYTGMTAPQLDRLTEAAVRYLVEGPPRAGSRWRRWRRP